MGVQLSLYKPDILSDSVLKDLLHKSVMKCKSCVRRIKLSLLRMGAQSCIVRSLKACLIFNNPISYFYVLILTRMGKLIFEVMAVLIFCSRVSPLAKIRMLFQLFDLGNKDMLNKSEIVLLIMCSLKGLAKLLHLTLPEENSVEMTVQGAFRKVWVQDTSKLLENIDVNSNPDIARQVAAHPNILYEGPHVGMYLNGVIFVATITNTF